MRLSEVPSRDRCEFGLESSAISPLPLLSYNQRTTSWIFDQGAVIVPVAGGWENSLDQMGYLFSNEW